MGSRLFARVAIAEFGLIVHYQLSVDKIKGVGLGLPGVCDDVGKQFVIQLGDIINRFYRVRAVTDAEGNATVKAFDELVLEVVPLDDLEILCISIPDAEYEVGADLLQPKKVRAKIVSHNPVELSLCLLQQFHLLDVLFAALDIKENIIG